MRTKTQIKMKLKTPLPITEAVLFVSPEEGLEEGRAGSVVLDMGLWNDMGSPLTVLVTIESD